MARDDYLNLKLLKNGSEPAFEHLYNQYSGKVYHFVLRLTNGNEWQTEELVQRTFIKVWENKEVINLEKSFISYLYTISKNMFLNELEHQMVEFIYKEYITQQKSYEEYDVDKEINLRSLEDMIDQLATQLPPARKRIFLLNKKSHYSVKEIAKELNLAESTVQTQLSKAITFMRKELAKYYFLLLLLC